MSIFDAFIFQSYIAVVWWRPPEWSCVYPHQWHFPAIAIQSLCARSLGAALVRAPACVYILWETQYTESETCFHLFWRLPVIICKYIGKIYFLRASRMIIVARAFRQTRKMKFKHLPEKLFGWKQSVASVWFAAIIFSRRAFFRAHTTHTFGPHFCQFIDRCEHVNVSFCFLF